ncbi:DUF1129 domain-containing protein [Bacillus sp. T33-2]|uniref:DUF1129 domain-containing protein n=1 Tax=Bacillus sp. T33-2 TaxID=2054168 RepID=UPI00115AC622|nr:DUF1129 domain-containing protein [Bacillus sp. T33-2]
MSHLEKAVEQLKKEGFSSEEIKNALEEIKNETLKEPTISVSLDEYFDSLDEE